MVGNDYFDIIQMPLVRQNDAGFSLAPSVIEQLSHFLKFRLEFFGLCGREFNVTTSVSDFHSP
jgi:hypothetical protein